MKGKLFNYFQDFVIRSKEKLAPRANIKLIYYDFISSYRKSYRFSFTSFNIIKTPTTNLLYYLIFKIGNLYFIISNLIFIFLFHISYPTFWGIISFYILETYFMVNYFLHPNRVVTFSKF